MSEDTELGAGEVAEILGCPHWKVQALVVRGLIPEPRRFGRYRVWTFKDVSAIRAAAASAGYLRGRRLYPQEGGVRA